MTSNIQQQFSYELQRLRNYLNYIEDIDRQYKNIMANYSMRNHYKPIGKTQDLLKFEKDIAKARQDATQLYNELERIRSRCQCNLNIEQDLRNYINRANSVKLPIFGDINVWYKEEYLVPEEDYDVEEEGPTGAAAMPTNPQETELSYLSSLKWDVQMNNYLNRKRPEARELANLFLVSPEKAPKSQNYKYIEPGYAEVLNKKYSLTGTNKEIKEDWSGFVFSKYSPLSKKVSNFSDVQNQIRKYYNPEKKQFIKDKLDVNFVKDTNLNYALGHATILEPTIDKDGYFHGILFDKYDFDFFYKNYVKDRYGTAANDYFYLLQLDLLKKRNFYLVAPISFKW